MSRVDREITSERLQAMQAMAEIFTYGRTDITMSRGKIPVYLSFTSRKGLKRHVRIRVVHYSDTIKKYANKVGKVPLENFIKCTYDEFIGIIDQLIGKEV